MTDDDQDLRDRLRALDPAVSLRPADPTRVARLLEHTMSDDLDNDIPETRQTGVYERSRLTWLVAAAAVLLIAGVGAFVLLERDTQDVPAAGPGGATGQSGGATGQSGGAADAATVTTLAVPANVGAAKCAVPSAEILARQEPAFEGVVDDISDGIVTLSPTTFYSGEPTDIVRVEAPPEVLGQLLLSVEFEVGERFLVSAFDGQVSVCGYSAPWSPELEQLYVEAFPG
jgi:hypothetical protein